MKTNDSKKKVFDEPTGLMGTQFALNITQGVVDAVEEAGVTKTQMLSWDQGELRLFAKKVTQKFLKLKNSDPWVGEKVKIEKFYRVCFGKKWVLNWSEVKFPAVIGNLKRPEFIFPEMNKVIDVAFDAYAKRFGQDKVWKAWKKIAEAMNYETVQPRPGQSYVMLHVGGDEPDLLGYSYDMGIEQGILFMTSLEGIISAFRYRFETGKMYDVVGLTRLAALDHFGDAICMCGGSNGKFLMGSYDRGDRYPFGGLRRVCF